MSPGPGAYDINKTNTTGFYAQSKYSNLKGVRFSVSMSRDDSTSKLSQKGNVTMKKFELFMRE